MGKYIIECRSLTYGQRTVLALRHGGIVAGLMRLPRDIAAKGCGYGVWVSEKRGAQAILLLKQEGMVPKHVYQKEGNGYYREVFL